MIIADAPPHGKSFCGYDNHNEEEQKLIKLLHVVFFYKFFQ
jgi:hypothetical protein